MHTKRRLDEQTRVKHAVQNIQRNKAFKRRIKGNFSNNLKKALIKLQKNKHINKEK